MSYNLFLDDVREVKDAYIYPRRDNEKKIITGQQLENISGIPRGNWVIVRTYLEFVSVITDCGIPTVVSFDHDLHQEHMEHYHKVTQQTGIIEYDNLKVKTGRDCALFLVNVCKTRGVSLPTCYIHSANKWGQEEIKKVLGN